MKKQVAIVGGGITGLSAAHFLSTNTQFPCKVLVFEKEARFGGQIETEIRDSFLIEGGPESFVCSKKATLELCRELGLERDLLQPNSGVAKTFMLHQGRFVELLPGIFSPFSQTLASLAQAFVKTPLLSWRAKLRMACEFFVPKNSQDSDEPLREFIGRCFGEEFFEVLLGPLLAGIYGGEPSKLSTKSVLRDYYEAEKKHGSIIRALARKKNTPLKPSSLPSSAFITLRGGLLSLIEKLKSSIGHDGLYCDARVDQIRHEDQGYTLKLSDRKTLQADAVVLAIPAYAAAKLVGLLDSKLARALEQIPYASSEVLTFGFRRADVGHGLKGFGFLVPPSEKLSFTACTWTSTKWNGRAPPGKILLRVYVPGVHADPDRVSNQVLAELAPILGIRGTPVFRIVHAHVNSLPQYVAGHSETVARIAEALDAHPGLCVAGAAYHGVGIPDCIESAKQAVAKLMQAS